MQELDQDTITGVSLEQMSSTQDGRFKELMDAAVRHLHDYARDVDLKPAELLAGLQQTGFVKTVKQWAIPAERIPDAAESLPDVVFLDLGRDPEPYFALGAQIRRARPTVKLVA